MASNQGSVKNLDLLCPSKRSSCNNNQCSNSKASDLLNACHCALRSQISGAMKAPDSPGDDISCISGLGKSNAAVNNCNNDGDKKTNESGSSVSVNSFASSQKAFNDSQLALCKMQGNSVELVNNHLKRSMKGSEPCIVDSSNSPPLREPSPKGEASVCSEEKGESSSTAKPLGGQEAGDVSEHLEMKDYKEKLLSVHHTYSAELLIPSGSADIKTGSDHADEEVRVCDICGDVGREDLLAICTKCIDGAEHIYCMCIKMDKVPAGDWLCEDCKINQESGMEREKKVEEMERLLKRSYSIKRIEKLGSFDPSNSKKRLQVDVGASDLEKKTADTVSCSPRMPSKISSSNSESSSMTKKRTLGINFLSPDGPHPQKKLFQDVSSLSQKNTAERKVRPFPSSDSPRTKFSDGKSRLLKSKSFKSGEMRLKDCQQQHQGHERRPIVSKNQGKGGHSKIFCKSQSFKDALSRCLVPDVSKTKILSSTSPRAANQIRLRQTEDNSSILQKSVLQFGSSSSDDKKKAQSGNLPAKPSASSNHCDLKTIQGCEHLIDSLESQKCPPQKVAGDQHDENNRLANNVKTESRCKANGSDANSSSRGLYLDSLVPCPGGVIPQVDISWKGGFEVSRGEGLTDLYPFIQAHKSNHACDKVDAAVKKLPQKIVLSEATRLSTWPTQFKDSPAMEENIALFFFAENLESYGAYKSLLERITVNDLALKGHLEGVELLILSSKVLPKEAQRWNNFLYLWGVFRITSVSPHENGPSSQNELHSPVLCTNNTSQQISTADDLPLTSPSRICENSESVLSSSGPKFLPVHTIDHQLCLINSFKASLQGGEGDLYRSRKLDLGFRKDNNTRDLAFGASNEEDHTNRKMKALVNGLPKPCSQNLNIFFDAGSSFYHRDLASSSGAENINDARIPTGDEQSTLEDVNLELSLGPVNQMRKRKALSLNFEPSDDKTCPMKRLQSDEEELSISIRLSLALPSRGEEDQEI